MSKTIAMTRLSIYVGASIILVAEGYRLILVFLSLIILAPSLFAILQNTVHLGLLFGFVCLAIGFFQLYNSGSSLLNPEEYSFTFIRRNSFLAFIMSVILVILILLPPTTAVTQDVTIFFSGIVSLLWTVYYVLLVSWLIQFWYLENKIKHLQPFIQNVRLITHISLGVILAIFWLLETGSLILLNMAIFTL
ncbi:unnamed protein product, partial [marine sediment metagenome]